MSANPDTAAPTGRNKPAQGKERSDATLGHESQNTSSPGGAEEGGEYPVGWRYAALGEILPLKYGKARSEQFGYPRPDTQTFGSNGAFGTFERALTTKPTLIVGRKGAAGAVHYSPDPCWPIDTAYYTEGNEDAFLSFFRYLLESLQLVRLDRSTAIPSLSRDDYSARVVHFPESLPEQRRIVAEIEKQFTRLEAGVAALRRVQANLKRYRAAVLKAACEGRLVPTEAELARQRTNRHPGGVQDISRGLSASDTPGHGSQEFIHPEGVAENAARSGIPSGCEDSLTDVPGVSSRPALLNPRLISASPPGFSDASYETGAALLARILTEHRQNWQGRGQYKEPFAPDTAHLPPLPNDWAWAGMRQVGEVQLGRQRAPQHHTGDNMRPYLRVANVFEARIDTADVKSMNFTPEEFPKYRLQYGDILLNEGQTPELVGRPAMFRDEITDCCYQKTLLRFRAYNGILPPFALIVFRSYLHNGRFTRSASITTNIAHLTAEKFVEIEFPLPPLAEQARIVAEVERRLSVVEELEAVVSANLQRAARLRQSILQKAFTGELTGAATRKDGLQVQREGR
jgi:restriction endonuclease S subunit